MNIKEAVREGNLKRVKKLTKLVPISPSDGYSLLCNALENKHSEISKFLLKSITEVNSESKKHSTTPLHLAVKNGDIEVVQMLLEKGANVNAINENGKTSLHVAVENGNLDIVKLLLNCSANVNAQDICGATPLCIAAKNGYLEVVDKLLMHGANINTTYSCDFKEFFVLHNLSGITPLHIAVQNGYLQIVEQLLKHKAYVNPAFTSTFKKDYTPIHLAAEINNKKIIKLLMKYGANICAKGKDNITPLHIAAQKGNKKVVELLLENGADIDAQDKDGRTVLYFAVQKGLSSVVETILKYLPDSDNKSNRNSLVVAVCGYGKEYKKISENLFEYGFTIIPEDLNLELLKSSVEKGYIKILEDVLNYNFHLITEYNLKYNNGPTLLHIAVKNKHDQVAELLIKHGVDVNATDEIGKTPIFYATANKDIKMIELLVASEANVKDCPDVLNMAVMKGSTKIVETLLQRDVDINYVDKYGRTALHFTALTDNEGSSVPIDKDVSVEKALIAELLLSKGANKNFQTKNGLSTLHCAVEKSNEAVVCVLLKYNANVNLKDINGMTPLHISAKQEDKVICELLLNKGANANAQQGNEETALHLASQKGPMEIVQLLVKYGAQVDPKNKELKTPLHIASIRANLEVLEFLLSLDADIYCKDVFGKTPLYYACEEKHIEVVKTLLEYGSDISIVDQNDKSPLDAARAAANPSSFKFYFLSSETGFDFHMGTVVNSGKEIIDILQRHIIKMNIANLYVNESDLLSITIDDTLSDFEVDCEKEIELLPYEMITYNISFFDILTRGLNQLVVYARNDNVVQFLKSIDYKIKFPIYGSLIISNIRKGIVRKKLLDNGITHFYSIFKCFPELPYDCTEKILCYFSDKELRILTGICKKSGLYM